MNPNYESEYYVDDTILRGVVIRLFSDYGYDVV